MISIRKKHVFLHGANLGGRLFREDIFRFQANFNRILEDQDLNMVLLKLVEYLGHTNPVISGVAFNEVKGFTLLVAGS
jgi:hypothetical protein